MAQGFLSDLLRPHSGEDARRVTFVELFFDLVFVFAVTQISHTLIAHPDLPRFVEVLILTCAVWWAWIDTAWITNWLNPERGAVRGMLIVLMLFGLLLSSAIPDSFGEKGALFAIAFVAMQLTRTSFTLYAFAEQRQSENTLNVLRILTWYVVSGCLWLWGGFAPEQQRIGIWLLALVFEFAGPAARFWLPRIGRSPLETWQVSGAHIAERVGLFFIIALGESIIVTGSVFSEQPIGWLSTASLLAAFAGTVLLWLLYFTHGERSGSDYIAATDRSGSVARATYTYVPILMVVGIVLSAVGDDLVLAHPLGHEGATPLSTAVIITGGGAVYLLGLTIFKRSIGGPWLLTHVVGILALVTVGLLFPLLTPLALTWLVNLVLLAVVAVDEWRFRRGRAASSEPLAADGDTDDVSVG
ncbi:low temperature requirement protein A [Rathayibacter sp. YIM 133350]|uniref:low temperature requirement protein A n=1 Tax=Rathayibacter sp. YIM 133350 TaxID=3131992 RepID=UPI00307E2C14